MAKFTAKGSVVDRLPDLRPAVFMHIQKTAGSSIVEVLRRHYGAANVVSHGDHLDGFSEFPLKDKSFSSDYVKNRFGDIPFVSGHFGYDFAKSLMQGRYSFTFLRDPAERIISFYYFCRTRDPDEFRIYKLSQQVTFDEFLRMGLEDSAVKACIWNTQTWQLAHGYGNSDGRGIEAFSSKALLERAIGHLEKFSYVGFAEAFENDCDRILAALGAVHQDARIAVNANATRPRAEDLSPKTLRMLDELTELDRIVYSHARKLREAGLNGIGLTRKIVDFGNSIKTWLAF